MMATSASGIGLPKCSMLYGTAITKIETQPSRGASPCTMKPRKKNSSATNWSA